MAAPLRVIQEIARRIAKVSKESKLAIDEEEYVLSFKVELMDAVVQWCKGASFTEICKVFRLFFQTMVVDEILSFAADRPVRRQLNSGVPTTTGTDKADVSGGESHWERRASGAIRQGFGDARATELCDLLLVVVPLVVLRFRVFPLSSSISSLCGTCGHSRTPKTHCPLFRP